MHFEFSTANRIIFGLGTCSEVPALALQLGQRALVISDSLDRVKPLIEKMKLKGIDNNIVLVKKEPSIKSVLMAIRIFYDSNCDMVIGFGGGSTLDTGKAVAVLVTNPGNPLDYLEVIGLGRTLEKPSVPFIAIPTTAGTGSEVTRNAVIAVPEKQVKVSLRSLYMLPSIAIVDPELTFSLPPEVTASTGLDALTQVLEPYFCITPSPLTDSLCREGITLASQSLLKVYLDGNDGESRENMSLVSLYSGMAMANARLGAVHGLAGPLGGMYSIPHGTICARLLPLVMEANLRALRSRIPESPILTRYTEVARILTSFPDSIPEDGITCLRDLSMKMSIPPLGIFGLKPKDFPLLISQAQNSSSMKGNPIELKNNELSEILEKAM
jgi:alcohol dehydrogenase class IV